MKILFECSEKRILAMLENAGFEAYFAGGCVRDALMGRAAEDIDVATDALPGQVRDVFSGCRVIETGIRHGTVTVDGVEVTTYRSDGTYSDGRHPDDVRFVSSIEEDLSRRDFTINAMACDIRGKLTDPYGGRDDIAGRIIRAVGDPGQRFHEDGLRIMRGLRFAAVLGFEIEENTAEAMRKGSHLLKKISAERIFAELKKLLAGDFAGDVLRRYTDVLKDVLPELWAMKGFEQHNPYHKYDVLEHCIRAMEAVATTEENLDEMKLAALFHDVGKPETYFTDDEGIGHFYGHPAKSEELVRGILHRLKADKATLERVAVLVKYHDLIFENDEKLLKRWMNRLGADVLRQILEIKLADNFATGNMSPGLERKFNDIRDTMAEIIEQGQCFSLKDLAVGGNDLIAAGLEPGPDMGRILGMLLDAVIDGKCENKREPLIELAVLHAMKPSGI